MRKWIVPVVALVMALSMILVLPGCGGDTSKAKELAQKANTIGTKIEDASSQLESDIESIFTETLASGSPDIAAFKADVDKVKTEFDDLMADAEIAKKDLEEIKTLKGVDNYVKWAEIQLELIDLAQQSGDKLFTFFDEIGKMIESGSLNEQAWLTAAKQFQDDMSGIAKKQEELQKEATELETKYKLIQ